MTVKGDIEDIEILWVYKISVDFKTGVKISAVCCKFVGIIISTEHK